MRLLIAILLLINSGLAFASKVPGYIIKNSSDTICGEIRVSAFDLYRGGTVLLGINLEPFHSAVYFREKGKNSFNSFTPKDVREFGFFNKSIEYRFKSFVIESNSIVKSERKRLRFLNLIYKGEVSLYRDIVRKDNSYMDGARNDRVIDYYDYYLFDDQHGLRKVTGTKDYKNLKGLLSYYEIDQSFVEQLSPNIRFKDIQMVLIEYEKWRKKNATKSFKTQFT